MIAWISRYIALWRFKQNVKIIKEAKIDVSIIEMWMEIIDPKEYVNIDYLKSKKIMLTTKHSCQSLIEACTHAADKIAKNESHTRLHPITTRTVDLDAWFTTDGEIVDVAKYLELLYRYLKIITREEKKLSGTDHYYHHGQVKDIYIDFHRLAKTLYLL